MSLPLARLQRGTQRVWLYDRLGAPTQVPATPAEGPAPAGTAAPGASPPPAASPPPTGAPPFRMMGGAPTPPPAPPPQTGPQATPSAATRRAFWRADDAAQYLRWWRQDPAACRELRLALQRLEPSTWVFAHTVGSHCRDAALSGMASASAKHADAAR